MTMTIRKLKMDEIPQAAAISSGCWNEDYSAFLPRHAADAGQDAASMAQWVSDDTCGDIRRLYGAFVGEEMIGFSGCSLAEPSDAQGGAELNYLFVRKEHRGKAMGMKLLRAAAVDFREHGCRQFVVYNFHESQSNRFYRGLGGSLLRQDAQQIGGQETLVDVFLWDTDTLIETLNGKLYPRSVERGGFATSQPLPGGVLLTSEHTPDDTSAVCAALLHHNIQKTDGLLKNPNVGINLFVKAEGRPIGAILCDTFNRCLYIDVLWLEEAYRGQGYGRAMIERAEDIARRNGCIFAHTCTFSYQSPLFYQACGYEVFAELRDYPDGIVQYFLKKKLHHDKNNIG